MQAARAARSPFRSTNHLLRPDPTWTCAPGRPGFITQGRLLPRDRCCACRRRSGRGRRACSAPARTRAASWRSSNLLSWASAKGRRTLFRQAHKRAVPRPAEPVQSLLPAYPAQYPLHRRRVERQRRDRIHRNHHRPRRAARVVRLEIAAGRRRTRRRGSVPSRVANEVMSARSSFEQNGHVSAANGPLRRRHRPQIRRRSAFGVMTAKSGSQPQIGQWPCVQRGQVGPLQRALRRTVRETGAWRARAPVRGSAGASGGVRDSDPSRRRRPRWRAYHCLRPAARARCRRGPARRSARWSGRSSASKRSRMSAVCRNVSRKSLHSSGMSPNRTSGRPACLLDAQPLRDRPESTAVAPGPARGAACRPARAACRPPRPAPAGPRFSCLSSTTSRDSDRGGRGGRSFVGRSFTRGL